MHSQLGSFIGIDPGKGGGIARVARGGDALEVGPMPETDRDVFEILDGMRTKAGWPHVHCFAVVERVSASPQMGVVSAFTFGRGYGALLMALAASGIPFELVSPVKWQTALGCRTKGDKNVSKRTAQQLFPTVKVTHAIADALLLAEYGRRTFGGTHGEIREENERSQGTYCPGAQGIEGTQGPDGLDGSLDEKEQTPCPNIARHGRGATHRP